MSGGQQVTVLTDPPDDPNGADRLVISLLSGYGQLEKVRAFHGSNYDIQSGKELALTDVVKNVNQDLAAAIENEMTGHM